MSRTPRNRRKRFVHRKGKYRRRTGKLNARRRDEELERAVFRPANYTCAYCGMDCRVDVLHYMLLSIDHLVPRALGGTTDLENLVCSCIPCNRLKGHFDALEALRRDGPPQELRDAPLRVQLIALCRAHIERRRATVQAELDREMRETYGKRSPSGRLAAAPGNDHGPARPNGTTQ